MDENVKWYRQKQIEKTIINLEKNNISGYFLLNEDELKQKIQELISEGSTVAVSDSVTLFETGIIDLLRSSNYTFLDKHREGITSEEKRDIYRKSFSSDTFLCSTNALTEDGELYNIDGNGSRVAPMIYGPSQVIVIAGINKLVSDLQEAEKRVRQYCAPLDAKRLNKNTPCTKLGYCIDCCSEERICNDFVIIKRQFVKGRIKVIIVDKCLGY